MPLSYQEKILSIIESGMTKTDIAQYCDVLWATVNNWANGTSKNLPLASRKKINDLYSEKC